VLPVSLAWSRFATHNLSGYLFETRSLFTVSQALNTKATGRKQRKVKLIEYLQRNLNIIHKRRNRIHRLNREGSKTRLQIRRKKRFSSCVCISFDGHHHPNRTRIWITRRHQDPSRKTRTKKRSLQSSFKCLLSPALSIDATR
jgi:hypothetical protein